MGAHNSRRLNRMTGPNQSFGAGLALQTLAEQEQAHAYRVQQLIDLAVAQRRQIIAACVSEVFGRAPDMFDPANPDYEKNLKAAPIHAKQLAEETCVVMGLVDSVEFFREYDASGDGKLTTKPPVESDAPAQPSGVVILDS